MVDTKRKVTKNGKEENAMAVRPCAPRPGLHSSQSAEFIDEGNSCCVETWAFARHQVCNPDILLFSLTFSAACHLPWAPEVILVGVAKFVRGEESLQA